MANATQIFQLTYLTFFSNYSNDFRSVGLLKFDSFLFDSFFETVRWEAPNKL